MEEYGICLTMECTIQPNPIRFDLFFIAVQNMWEDQSNNTWWQVMISLIKLLVPCSDFGKKEFQVFVSNDQGILFRILWWQDGDLRKQPVDHEKFVHVFGGTSSLSCSNYALKRNSIDGKDQFGLEAAKKLQNNFYKDDLLKSVAREDQ